MIKTLPVYDSKLCGHPIPLDLLSIIGNERSGRIWFIQNNLGIISINCPSDLQTIYSGKYQILFQNNQFEWSNNSWMTCGLIDKLCIDRSTLLDKFKSIKIFLKYYIDKGYFVFLLLNTSYINEYHMQPRSHPIMIHGYNQDAKEFFCSDFFGDPPKYRRVWIPYDNIEKAFNHLFDVCSKDDFHICMWKNEISLAANMHSLIPRYSYEKIHIPLIYKEISKYLNADNSEIPFKYDNTIKVGIEVYTTLYNELKRCIHKESQISLTYMYIFMDHFTVYEMLIDELAVDYPNNIIDFLAIKNKLHLIKDIWSKALILMIKANQYLYKKNTLKAISCYNSSIKLLTRIKEGEKDMLTSVISLLHKL